MKSLVIFSLVLLGLLGGSYGNRGKFSPHKHRMYIPKVLGYYCNLKPYWNFLGISCNSFRCNATGLPTMSTTNASSARVHSSGLHWLRILTTLCTCTSDAFDCKFFLNLLLVFLFHSKAVDISNSRCREDLTSNESLHGNDWDKRTRLLYGWYDRAVCFSLVWRIHNSRRWLCSCEYGFYGRVNNVPTMQLLTGISRKNDDIDWVCMGIPNYAF